MLFCCSLSFSQTESLNVQTSARGIALGEGLVALPQDESALMYNPASLAGIEGVQFSWSYRPQDHHRNYRDGFSLRPFTHSFSLNIGTPFLTIGIMYNRVNLVKGKLPTLEPEGVFPEQNQTVAAGIAYLFPCSLSLGATIKLVKHLDTEFQYTPTATLYDIGALYTASGFVKTDGKSDRFSVGLALQNLGANTRYSYANPTTFNYSIQEPRYLRVGLSYEYFTLLRDERRLTPFGALVVAEYRRIVNDVASSDSRDFSGAGLEARIYEMVSLRLGFYNFHSEYSDAATRYGADVHAPLQKLGIDVPIEFSFEYSALCLPTGKRDLPYVLSAGVAYTTPLF